MTGRLGEREEETANRQTGKVAKGAMMDGKSNEISKKSEGELPR